MAAGTADDLIDVVDSTQIHSLFKKLAANDPDQFVERFSKAVLNWWGTHGRTDLPWQQNQSRYRVWVSEIMLQQTQVVTVERYYDRFLEAFPTVDRLAAAEPDAVLHLWSGLGYYARARNLHKAARQVVADYDGDVPADFDALISLPGIGRSTAGAILALADNQRHPILDGNAKRVYARYFGVEGWPGKTKTLNDLWHIAETVTPGRRVDRYTQAIMDLGATLCVRRNPACARCPLNTDCVARLTSRQHDIPAAKPKKSKPHRSTILVLAKRSDGSVLLERRPDSGIWGGLWCFPEADQVDQVENWCQSRLGCVPETLRVCPDMSHSFTHFTLNMTPVEADIDQPDLRIMDGDSWLWYNPIEPAEVGLAAPVARLLAEMGGSS